MPAERLSVGGRFRACGLAGLAAASALSLGLSAARDLSLLTQGAVIVTACAVFVALALVTKAVVGREQLVYYHHEVAVLSACGGLLVVLGAPVLAHLDVTAAGLGAFLVGGRTGCLLAGCCHGRPARRGVRYGPEHAAAGFPGCLVGVRLLPVQALEAVGAAALAAAGSTLVAAGEPAGSALGLYVSGYAVLRFALEPLRGDAARPYHAGLSAAQWWSLGLAATVAAAGVAGLLPGGAVHVGPALAIALAAVAVRRRHDDLFAARHVCELAEGLQRVDRRGSRPVTVFETSLGVRLSRGRDAGCEHYTLSRRPGALSGSEGAALARLVLRLRHDGAEGRIVPGVAGAVHVVVRG